MFDKLAYFHASNNMESNLLIYIDRWVERQEETAMDMEDK